LAEKRVVEDRERQGGQVQQLQPLKSLHSSWITSWDELTSASISKTYHISEKMVAGATFSQIFFNI
jgi:hypothetical protein